MIAQKLLARNANCQSYSHNKKVVEKRREETKKNVLGSRSIWIFISFPLLTGSHASNKCNSEIAAVL